LRLDVAVEEKDVARVQVGQPADVTFDALPGKTYPAKVVVISPSAVDQSGVSTYVVSITLQNTQGIRPGMTGNAQIVYARHDKAVLVPNRALRADGSGHVVSILDGKKIVAAPVTVGVSNDQFTEIVSGLQPRAQI